MSRGAEGAARIERVYRERYGAFLRVAVPAVLEAITDPEVPPLPPHITLEQPGTSCSPSLAATAAAAPSSSSP